jgi:DNA repair exonuclease SbcCD nuclease subunit
MSLAIFLGDPHIGKGINIGKAGIGSTLNSRIADQINLLDWTLERSVEHGSDNIIITGDVFDDPKPHPSLIVALIAWLKKCQAYNVHVHIIMGNHDMLRTGSVFNSPLDIIMEMDLENVSVYKNINTIFIGTTAFTLMPFRDRKSFSVSSNVDAINLIKDSLAYELAGIPLSYNKVVIGHFAIEGSIPIGDEIDDVTNELFCPLNMFNGYNYVWMGHIHKAQIMKKNNPFIAHIGSMDISNFGETDQEKHIVVFDCNARSNHYMIEILPTRPLKRLSIIVPKDTTDTTAYVLEEIKKANSNYNQAIVRVEVSLAVPELQSIDKGQIEKFLTLQGAFNITGISESKKLTLIKKDIGNSSIDTKMDVPTAIKAYADRYVDVSVRAEYIEESMDIYNVFMTENKL